MFVRKKPNKSGTISVQVIEKRMGKYKVVKTIGSSQDLGAVDHFVKEGEAWVKSQRGMLEIPFCRDAQVKLNNEN